MNIKHRHIINVLRLCVVLLFTSAFFSRCASILTPTGGPKDSLPPVIITMEPDNFTTNFATDKVYIEFDEFVQIKDQQKEFYTSPAMKKNPTILNRGRGILITIKDTLLENTTYSLNFGSSIRDNNEGNPLNAMRYVFSTGSTIDSMIVSGYTADSYKADSVSKTFIYMYPVDSLEDTPDYDSTLFKLKPTSIARAENNGIFIAQNLKPIKYRFYAVEDTNNNMMYEPGVDQVGFLDKDYSPQELPQFGIWYDSIRRYPVADPQLYFRMFLDKAFKRQIIQESKRPLQHQALLYFGAPNPKIESITFDSIPSDKVIIDPQTVGRDTVALWFNVPSAELPDTLKTYVEYFKHDSLNRLVLERDTIKLSWRFIETKEQQAQREKLEREREKVLDGGGEWVDPTPNPFGFKLSMKGEINPEEHLTIDFDYPLVKIDTLSMLLTSEAEDNTVTDEKLDFVRDTANIRRWYLKSKWDKLGSNYTLTIPEGALQDVAGFSNDSIIGNYTVSDPVKYAKLIVNVKPGIDPVTRYIVQLMNTSNKVLQEKKEVASGELIFNYVPAGEVRIRIIEDKNGNGKWDSGNAVKRRQPERSEIFSQNGEENIATKENWDVDIELDMATIFAPVTQASLVKMLDDREAVRYQEQLVKEAEAARNRAKQQQGQHQHGGNSSQSFGGFGGLTQGF